MAKHSLTAQLVGSLEQTAATPEPTGLLPASQAILWLAARGELDAVPAAAREAWGALLQASQSSGAELFADASASDPAADAHRSQFALQALDALGLPPRDWPIAMLQTDPAHWLAALDWSEPLAASATASLRLMWLVLWSENHADAEAMACFHAALTWLDQAQDFATGLWGQTQGAAVDDALLAASRLLVFFEYVRRPVRHVRQLLDVTLERINQGYLLGPARGAESAASLAWLLATYYQQFNYRRDDLAAALARLEASLPLAAEGELDAAAGDGGTESTEGPTGLGLVDLQAAWWGALTRALIAQTRAAAPEAGWQFTRRPGPGCFPRPALSSHERQALPLWLGAKKGTAGAATQPVITVVIPVFNLGRYLQEAVESVLAQTYQDFEIVIIDDGSTDEYSRLLLEHWPYTRASVLRQANQGVAAARNRAISQGRGRYICCLDADDRLRPVYFERAVGYLDTDPHIGFVSGQMQMFDGDKTLVVSAECALPGMLAENLAFEPAMFRRAAWEAAGGYCPTFSVSGIEDWDLWISFLELGYHCQVLPDVIFDYRVLPNSMTSRMQQPDSWAVMVGELVARHPVLYRDHLASVLTQNARRIAELRAWANSLVKTHAWLEQQALSWKQNSERLERLLAAQIEWTQQLQSGKEWLEQQLRAMDPQPEKTND